MKTKTKMLTADLLHNEGVISAAASRVAVCVIRTEGELMIARSVWCVEGTSLERKAPPRAELAMEGATV